MTPQSRLIACGVFLCSWCASLSLLSQRFASGQPLSTRPVPLFTAAMAFAFIVSMVAIHAAVRLRRSTRTTGILIGFACLMRLALLPSHPIQEIDIYRYMWDGVVMLETGDPWKFSPAEVRETASASGAADLQQLTALRDSSLGIRKTLHRIHYSKLTTIYPPVSQVVFAAAAALTPQQASVRVRLMVTRAVITLFDILTIFAMLRLLRMTGKPDGWSVAYAWSPLVLKEFANSGHLDAIAICLCTWAIVYWIEGLRCHSRTVLVGAACLLGLAVGAKLYPVVLAPVIAVSVWRRLNFSAVALTGVVFLLVCSASLWPMFGRQTSLDSAAARTNSVSPQTKDVESLNEGQGINAFVRTWKMNQFAFLLIEENLAPGSRAWFAVTPQSLRMSLTQLIADRFQISRRRSAFFITRTITMLMWLCIVGWLSWRMTVQGDRQLLHAAFLSIAWLWALLPTMNPWYWIWAMPLLPFARLRSWLLVSGLVGLYYIRFWFTNSFSLPRVPGTIYTGRQFFAMVVVWIEHVPWKLALLFEFYMQSRRTKKVSRVTGNTTD